MKKNNNKFFILLVLLFIIGILYCIKHNINIIEEELISISNEINQRNQEIAIKKEELEMQIINNIIDIIILEKENQIILIQYYKNLGQYFINSYTLAEQHIFQAKVKIYYEFLIDFLKSEMIQFKPITYDTLTNGIEIIKFGIKFDFFADGEDGEFREGDGINTLIHNFNVKMENIKKIENNIEILKNYELMETLKLLMIFNMENTNIDKTLQEILIEMVQKNKHISHNEFLIFFKKITEKNYTLF